MFLHIWWGCIILFGVLGVIGFLVFFLEGATRQSHFQLWLEAREDRKRAEREAQERQQVRDHELALEKERTLNWTIPSDPSKWSGTTGRNPS